VTVVVGGEGSRGRSARVSTVRGERSEEFWVLLFDSSSIESFRFLELRVDVAIKMRSG